MSTRAIVGGVVSKPAEVRTSKNGNPFVTATIRENLNGSSRWWQAIAFDKNTIEALKEISVGEPIAVAGEITAEICAPASSESRINWRIPVDAVLSEQKPPNQPKANRKLKEGDGRDRGESSWASPTRTADLNDSIPL